MRRGWLIPSSRDSPVFQERHGNRLCCGTGQEAAPSAVPSSSNAPSEDPRSKESFRLFRPPPSNLASDHHQPHATVPALELWISLLFVSPRFSQGDAVCSVRVPSVDPVRMQSRHQSGVQSQLAAAEERQAFRHNFQSSFFFLTRKWMRKSQ